MTSDDPIDGKSFLTMYEWDGAGWVGTSLLTELTHAGHSLDIVDFNNDGLLDIFNAEMTLGGNPDAAGRVFYGDGTGQFTVQEFSTGIEHHQSKVGDLDRDGDLDILGKPFTDGSPAVHIWLNKEIDAGCPSARSVGATQRRPRASPGWRATRSGATSISTAAMDIVSGGWIYHSQAGDYAQPWSRTLIGAPLNNVALVHDFDDDGDLDLLGTDGLSQSPDPSRQHEALLGSQRGRRNIHRPRATSRPACRPTKVIGFRPGHRAHRRRRTTAYSTSPSRGTSVNSDSPESIC